jgi:hypothetical protein
MECPISYIVIKGICIHMTDKNISIDYCEIILIFSKIY